MNIMRRSTRLDTIVAGVTGMAAVAGVAWIVGTSMAFAQIRRPYPMSKHPIGSEIVDRIAPSEMRGMLNAMAADSRGAILPKSLDGRAQYIVNARREASEPERHAAWDDVMIVQSGYGFVDYSRSIKGGKRYGPGEWRGGVLTPAPTTLDLAPGVVVRIPAGVPHVIRPLGAAPLVYLVLKERTAAGAPAVIAR
jgi:mannose-6-phosphate isomerase-like protein (cupin superfamily)